MTFKQIISLFLIILNSNFLYIWNSYASVNNEYRKFYVTAYYSPLPNQSFYLKWNYEDEKKLNWEWIRWASGREVYIWMIAAPKNYAFWTKIHFEGLWYWIVDDRWWAIVGSGSRGYDGDRIDIWMWHGEDWLRRALNWWKRVVYGKIISDNELYSYDLLNINNFQLSKTIINIPKTTYVAKNNISENKNETLPISITKNSKTEDIKKIQEILKNLWYYSWDINWIYDKNIIDSIAEFQLKNNLIKSYNEYGVWWYWPKTKQTLTVKYNEFLVLQKKLEEDRLLAEKLKKLEEEKNAKDLALIDQKITNFTSNIWTPKTNEVWIHIRKLQKTLKILGFFEDKDTAIFWPKTQQSLLNYQISRQLVSKWDDPGAWMIWEKTLAKIKEDLKNIIITDRNKLKEIEI